MVAKCCCGMLCVEVSGVPEKHGICHCNDCKRRSGSAFGISMYFRNERIVRITGDAVRYELTNQHDGSEQQRFFCKSCGSTVYWRVSTFPDLTGVAGGCFEKPYFGKPDYSVSGKNRLNWVKLPWGMKQI